MGGFGAQANADDNTNTNANAGRTIVKGLIKSLLLVALMLMPTTMVHGNYVDQVSLEQNFTSKAQRYLDGRFGEGRVVAVANVALGGDSWQIVNTEQSNVRVRGANGEGGGKVVNILPGRY